MLMTCPQCKTIFRVDHLRLHPAGHAKPRSISSQDSFAGDGGSDLRWVNDITHTKPRVLTAYFPKLISGFHRIGLLILPPISKTRFLRLDIVAGARAEVSVISILRLIFD